MTLKSSNKGFTKDFAEFGGIVRADELSGSGEGVLSVGGVLVLGSGLVGDGGDFDHLNFDSIDNYKCREPE